MRFSSGSTSAPPSALVMFLLAWKLKETKSVRLYDWLFRRVEDEQIQQELFRRNLAHISEPQARRLAMPGMVVRRLTAGVIAEVLAEPCGIGRIDEEKAKHLIEILKGEPNIAAVDVMAKEKKPVAIPKNGVARPAASASTRPSERW